MRMVQRSDVLVLHQLSIGVLYEADDVLERLVRFHVLWINVKFVRFNCGVHVVQHDVHLQQRRVTVQSMQLLERILDNFVRCTTRVYVVQHDGHLPHRRDRVLCL